MDLNIKIYDCPPLPAIPALSRRFEEPTLAIELSVSGRESAIANANASTVTTMTCERLVCIEC